MTSAGDVQQVFAPDAEALPSLGEGGFRLLVIWDAAAGSFFDSTLRAIARGERMSTKSTGAATIFVVSDVLKSVAYYRDALGFEVSFSHGEPVFYAGVERGKAVIHLQAASETKRRAGEAAVYVFVDDADAVYEETKDRGARIVKEPQEYAYGMRDFDVTDLDGNAIAFGSPV